MVLTLPHDLGKIASDPLAFANPKGAEVCSSSYLKGPSPKSTPEIGYYLVPPGGWGSSQLSGIPICHGAGQVSEQQRYDQLFCQSEGGSIDGRLMVGTRGAGTACIPSGEYSGLTGHGSTSECL